MTDNEIIKALENHIDEFDKNGISVDNNRIDKLALDLINRQQAEIEKLTIENQILRMAANSYRLHYNEERVKAVRDFAEALKFVWFDIGYDSPDVDFDDFVDTLVEKMAGET